MRRHELTEREWARLRPHPGRRLRHLGDRKGPAVLSSLSATEQERLEARNTSGTGSACAAHGELVICADGDQPSTLHVSSQDDRGGNSIGVSGVLCSWEVTPSSRSWASEYGSLGRPCPMMQWSQTACKIDAAGRHGGLHPDRLGCVHTDTGCWHDVSLVPVHKHVLSGQLASFWRGCRAWWMFGVAGLHGAHADQGSDGAQAAQAGPTRAGRWRWRRRDGVRSA